MGFIELAAELRQDDRLLRCARSIMQGVLADCAPALDDAHSPLVEDYFVFSADKLEPQLDGSTLLALHQHDIVRLMMAELRPIAPEEQAETLRLRFSYYPDDLLVVQWDSAFFCGSKQDADVIIDLLEFANTQLVEFRTYDAQLDAELDAIYASDFPPTVRLRSSGRREATQRAAQLRYLLVDIRELADRASNALKITGDAYYARIYRAIATRLGIDVWQRQIETKLDAVDDVYRYLVDQAQVARSEFLELIVIILIAIEIVVGVIGLRH